MKKILLIFVSLMMLVMASGCAEKDKRVTVNVSVNDEDPDVLTYSGKVKTIKDVFDVVLTVTNYEYESESLEGKTHIISVFDLAETENSYWTINKNGEELEDTIENTKVEDGDVINLIYINNEPEEGEMVGAWKLFDKYNVVLNDKETEVFFKATTDMVSVSYAPIRVIATQVVNGTNYAYLVTQTKIIANPVEEFYIVKIFEDLDGNVEFKAVNKLDPLNIVEKETNEPLLGGWEIMATDNSGVLLDEKAQATFNEAMMGYTGLNLQPIQLLATQLVSGMNYMALCRGETVTENPTAGLYVVTWYAPLDGASEITDLKLLNLEYYVTGE